MGIVFVIGLGFVLVSCATVSDRYLGDTYYYSVNGVEYECREPEAYFGGNCKPAREWDNLDE